MGLRDTNHFHEREIKEKKGMIRNEIQSPKSRKIMGSSLCDFGKGNTY